MGTSHIQTSKILTNDDQMLILVFLIILLHTVSPNFDFDHEPISEVSQNTSVNTI